ncbi:MAG: response regulator [Desulfobacterales bacterium]|nr:response regulator [Desulfobacterales bacterium]
MDSLKKYFLNDKALSSKSWEELDQVVESRTEELLRTNARLESEIKERRATQEALQMQNSHLEALQEISIDIVSQLETKTLLRSIITKVGALLDSQDAYIALHDKEKNELNITVATGKYKHVLHNYFKPGEGACGRILNSGEPLLVKNYQNWEGKLDNVLYKDLNSLIGAPLKKGSETIGVLTFGFFNEKEIGEYELNLLSSFSKPAAIALSNANLMSELNMQLSEKEMVEKEKEEIYKQLLHSQKMEAIGTLAGGIAHDMNNILMAIQGNVSLLKLKSVNENPDYKRFNNISDLVASGSRLTRQILGFARGGKYKVESANVNTILHKTCNVFGRTRKNINIHENYTDKIWSINADKSQIEQVLLNLFVNAYHAMPGNGDIYINTENTILTDDDVALLMIEAGEYVKISIRDTGEGMSNEVMERVFEPFFTTKAMSECSGLGLASAYGIIKNHNGLINVESEERSGTTFNIYIPASGTYTNSQKSANFKKRIHGNEKILLIDDEDLVREICSEYLEELGYHNICVGSGKEGIEIYKLDSENIDMVIIDLVMPDMSGQETFEALKKINKDVKVLLSSGYSLKENAAKVLDQADFIQKPFNITDFSTKIREVLRNN